MSPEVLDYIKREVRDEQLPYFTDKDIEHYFVKNDSDVEATVYELLVVKSEDSTISVSGLTTADTSSYFRRLASKHRRYNSGVLHS